MISINDAKERVLSRIDALPSEEIRLSECVGRVLAEDIFADIDLPPFDRSQMDGFAVRTGDVTGQEAELEIVGESVAGRGWDGTVGSGQAVRIMTGAPVPGGADAVQMVEKTRSEGNRVNVRGPVRKDQNIVRRAAEIERGSLVIPSGTRVRESMVATLASFGYSSVPVAKRPRLGILSTGSEIVAIDETPGPDQIRNSNSAMLAAFSAGLADAETLPIVKDDPGRLRDTIASASDRFDCLVISGGVSAGDYDFTRPVLRELGAKIHFEKLSLKPGKPTVFAELGDAKIFGLPGNPVSIAVTFLVFVRSALLAMQGANETGLPRRNARLDHNIKGAKGRDSMLPVKLGSNENGELTVETLKFSGSSNFVAFAGAEAFVFVPADSVIEKGEVAEIHIFQGN